MNWRLTVKGVDILPLLRTDSPNNSCDILYDVRLTIRINSVRVSFRDGNHCITIRIGVFVDRVTEHGISLA